MQQGKERLQALSSLLVLINLAADLLQELSTQTFLGVSCLPSPAPPHLFASGILLDRQLRAVLRLFGVFPVSRFTSLG